MKRLLLLALALLLSSCAVFISPDDPPPRRPSAAVSVQPLGSSPQVVGSVSPVSPGLSSSAFSTILSFAPDRGEGGFYGLGEEIRFTVQVERSGYLNLSVRDASGETSVLLSGQYVSAGSTLTLPNSGARFVLAPPRGRHDVTATLSSDPEGNLVQDTAESYFYLR